MLQKRDADLQLLLLGEELGMQLHYAGLLLTAPPVRLNYLLPHVSHLRVHPLPSLNLLQL